MAKKKEIIVDEELIRDMIRGNVPTYQSAEPVEVESSAEELVADVVPQQPPSAESKKTYSKKRKKEVTESYTELFLVNQEFKNRVTLNINRKLVPVNFSLTTYTQDLEPTGYLGEDKDLSPDHFEGESLQGAYIPTDEELYDEQEAIAAYNTEMEGGGVTFDELNEVVDVLTSKTAVDKERRIGAGKIIAKITNTTFYDILASEVGGMLTVSSLEQEYFTSEGEAIRSKVDKIEDIRFKEFDISIYT